MNDKRPDRVWIRILLPVLWAAVLHLAPAPVSLDRAYQVAAVAAQYQVEQAEAAALQTILEYHPWNPSLWEKLGTMQARVGDPAAAIQAYRRAEQLGGLTTGGRSELAEQLWLEERTTEAIAVWRPLMDAGLVPLEVFYRAASAQRASGDWPAAQATLALAVQYHPGEASLHYELGLLNMLVDVTRAQDELQHAVRLNPNLAQPVHALQSVLANQRVDDLSLGRVYAGLVEWDLAAAAFGRAAEKNPGDAEAWAFLGEALQQTGRNGQAELDRALELQPASPTVRALAAISLRRNDQPEQALMYFRGLAEDQPDEAVWQIEMAATLSELGKLNDSLAHYQAAAEIAPKDPLVWMELATFCLNNGIELRSVGLPAIREALLLSPNDPAALDLMGWLLFQLGDSTSAARFLQRSVTIQPQYPLANLHLGQYYLALDRPDLAYAYLQRVLEADHLEGWISQLAQRLLDQDYGGGG